MLKKKMKTAKEILSKIYSLDLLGEKDEKRDCIVYVLDFLKKEIPRYVYVSDKDASYQKTWEDVGKWFEKNNRIHEAKIIFETLYVELVASQIENNCYIHKGMPLVWLCDYSNKFGQTALAQRYLLLTIIEDSIASVGKINPNTTGSYFRAVWLFGIKHDLFDLFQKKTYEVFIQNKEMGKFPEWILNNLEDMISIKYPSREEIDIFTINLLLAKIWFKNINSKEKKEGKDFENFCAYLISCIPGFEIDKRFTAQDYHFDLLIRNKSFTSDFRTSFGNYLIAECKNWSSSIGTQEVSYFVSKLVFHDIKAGFIFSQKGVTGEKKNKDAALVLIKSFYKIGKIIMIIDQKDINKIISGGNFISML